MSRLFRHSAPKRDSDCPRRREVSSAGRKTNNREATAGTAIVCWCFKEYYWIYITGNVFVLSEATVLPHKRKPG